MTTYYKYVAIRDGEEDWMYNELEEGRARFGWSSPGSDLRQIESKAPEDRTVEEKVIWRYTQFMITKLVKGDRLVIQLQRPLRKFLIAEVTGSYQSTDPEETDFNHYVECKLITKDFMNVESKAVSQSLRHHLSKRGQYYKIYSEDAQKELNDISSKAERDDPKLKQDNEDERTKEFDIISMKEDFLKQTYQLISKKWPSAQFEKLVEELIEVTPGLEMMRAGDTRKGWDLTINIPDPFDKQYYLHEEIPVQCKNYTNEVTDFGPISDLERCSENSESTLVYLFIMGDLTEKFNEEFEKRLEIQRTKRYVDWRIVGQKEIAKMYLEHLVFKK